VKPFAISLSIFMTLMAGRVAGQPAGAAPPQPQFPTTPAVELSLDEAVSRAITKGEEVQLAQSDIAAAETRIAAAQAARLPKLDATTAYQRTFQSAFSGGALNFGLSAADRFNPDPNAPLAQRVQYLEQNARKAVVTTLSDLLSTSLQGVGLGSPHAYSVNLAGSQLLYSGGRVGASVEMARAGRDAARFSYRETAAQTELDVRTAYYRALLAQELETSAQAALAQADSFLKQERLRLQAGFASDLDVLRAEVSLENLRPQLVSARNTLELALLDLKRLVNVPMTQPVRLTTALTVPPSATLNEPLLPPDAVTAQRPAVQASERQVAAREQGVRLARAAYMPTVSVQATVGGQVFPQTLFGFSGTSWQPASSATVALQLPIVNLQRGADLAQAKVQVRQAQLQTVQLRESVQLQYQQAVGERERARATIAARQRTVDQAQRVYDLTLLRYEQGQSTQLEISDSRLALLQARTNLAQALSDFYIADAGVTRALGATTIQPPAAEASVPTPAFGTVGWRP
jgi:outer membrane protein TolC